MSVWILRYPEPRERPGSPWKLVVLHRTPEGDEAEVDVFEIERRSPSLQEIVQSQLGRGHSRLVLDLTYVKHLDSSDLAQLLGALKEATDAGGRFVIANSNTRIREIFRITRLEEVLPLADSIEAAVELLDEPD